MNLFAEEIFTNVLISNSISFSEIETSIVETENSVIQTMQIDTPYRQTILPVLSAASKEATIPEVIGTTFSCQTLNVNTLNVPEYVVTTLFATQIDATTQVDITTYKPVVHKNTGLTKAQILAIVFGVLAAVAIAVAIVVTVGTASAAIPAAAGFVFEASVSSSSSAALLAAIAAENAVVVGTTTALSVSAISTTTALGITVGVTTAGAVGSLVAMAVLTPDAPDPTNPTLRPKILNSTYGKSFLSDIIFGTTSYKDVTASYVNFLIIQNELNGSYTLPRLLSFNPQLGFFDDAAYYGSQNAYLSICTNATYNTLRFEANGNLAIYTNPSSAPTWQSSTQVSSRKYKTNIRPIENALSKLETLDCIKYRLKDEAAQVHLGVVAQQVLQVLEEAVFGSEVEGYRVRLEKLVPLIIEGMKDVFLKQERIFEKIKNTDKR
jgi:Chaperone of endosialidase